jgi:flagellar motor switch protein FliN/FliY
LIDIAELETEPGSLPQIVELAELNKESVLGNAVFSDGLDAIRNVKGKLTVVAGEATLSIGELLEMKENQVIKLDCATQALLDVLLEGCLIARGRLVVVGENFGIQITELPQKKR